MIGYNLEEQARLTRWQRAFLLRGMAYYTRESQQANKDTQARTPARVRTPADTHARASGISPELRSRMQQRLRSQRTR